MKPHVLIGQNGKFYMFIVRLRYMQHDNLGPIFAVMWTQTTMS